jgi:hypothetical protein
MLFKKLKKVNAHVGYTHFLASEIVVLQSGIQQFFIVLLASYVKKLFSQYQANEIRIQNSPIVKNHMNMKNQGLLNDNFA